MRRPLVIWLLLLLGSVAILAVLAVLWMTRMPGRSLGAALPPLTGEEVEIRDRIARHVEVLAGDIGERNASHPENLHRAERYLIQTLTEMGYEPGTDPFPVGGETMTNVEVISWPVQPNSLPHFLVVGAHYDSAIGSPGANDNGSGVAAVLELARLFRGASLGWPVRWVFFVNEEPPFFGTESMGSLRYAKKDRPRNERILGMISVETVGYYSDAPQSQKYPSVLQVVYPKTGNFIAFVSNLGSRRMLRQAITAFRKNGKLPSQGGSLPGSLDGVGWSDQWAFWEIGCPAIMVTDTALFRYPAYHTARDLPGEVDPERVARLVTGLRTVILELVGGTGRGDWMNP